MPIANDDLAKRDSHHLWMEPFGNVKGFGISRFMTFFILRPVAYAYRQGELDFERRRDDGTIEWKGKDETGHERRGVLKSVGKDFVPVTAYSKDEKMKQVTNGMVS